MPMITPSAIISFIERLSNIPFLGSTGGSFITLLSVFSIPRAIAGSESAKASFGGTIYGYASNQKVLQHYMEKMNATHVGILHPYQFCVFEKEMQEIIKTYTYAYSGEEI